MLPNEGGRNVLADVPSSKHPTEVDLNLIYIGIAPSGTGSESTLRSRVVGNHMRGNIAASTLRRTLAALLLDKLALTPIKKGEKVTLPREQNAQLSQWQQRHLRLTWHPAAEPWALEKHVIAEFRPPLNLADNQAHPFYKALPAARHRLREAAR